MKYDPEQCERLVKEAREDDERLGHGGWLPWTSGGAAVWWSDNGNRFRVLHVETLNNPNAVASAIARTRNNLRAMADQLEAARREVERLRADSKVAWEQADILADGLEQACSALVADRGADALRAKLRRLYREAYRAAKGKAP